MNYLIAIKSILLHKISLVIQVLLCFYFLDLKIYRKIKEREKQQRKEEIKTKIISKQQALIKEAHEYQNIDFSLINVPSESSNSNDDESLVKVRIKCIPKVSKKEIQKDINKQKHTTATVIKSDEKLSTIKYCKEDIQIVKSDKICCKQDYSNIKPFPIIRCTENENRRNVFKYLTADDYLTKKYKLNLRAEDQAKPITSVFEQSVCEPKLSNVCGLESKSIALDPTENVYTQNILSSRSSINSRQKSCKLYIVIHNCTYAVYMCLKYYIHMYFNTHLFCKF